MPSDNNSNKGFGMANSDLSNHTTSVKDVKQLGIWAAIGSLGYVFWICGAMEMVERLAYYGVRQVSSLYATDAQSNGGLGLPGTEIGIIFLLFLVGLDLQPSKLKNMVGATTVVALASAFVFFAITLGVMMAFGFPLLDALIVGIASMFSSTIVGIKLLPITVLHHRHIGEIVVIRLPSLQ